MSAASGGIVGSKGFKSRPARLFASEEPYQVKGNSGPGKTLTVSPSKSDQMKVMPVEPSTPEVGVQERGSSDARMRISTGESRVFDQSLAASLNAFMRCSPSVVPLLPPTGTAGVGSLNPIPGALLLMIVILALPNAC